MKVPFVSFVPLEKELDSELRNAFDRVFTRSWYIEGEEDKAFENCTALENVKLYEGMLTIPEKLFQNCKSLKNVI